MAVKLDLGTPDTGPIDSNNPDGTYLDEGPGIPGTPVLEKNKNSVYYFFSRMMDAGALAFNGLVDNFSVSQFFDAFLNVIHGGAVVAKWDFAEAAAYEAAGVLVQDISGKHYTSTGKALNEDKDPADPANSDYWYPSGGAELLETQAKIGLPVKSGMHNITNVQHAQFAQHILEERIKKGATIYNLFQVIPDGSVLTGDAPLEAIMAGYPYLDIYAPDVLGTRTFIDIRGYGDRGMTDVGGVAATLGEVQIDEQLKITGTLSSIWASGPSPTGVFTTATGNANRATGAVVDSTDITFDSSLSISPIPNRTNDVENRDKNLVTGVSSIKVMIAV